MKNKKRFIIELNKVSDRNRALNIRVDGRTPLRWDRYERGWYIEDENCLPLYEEFKDTATKGERLSDVGRQMKNIREFTEKIFSEKEAEDIFFSVMFRFRNMNLDNILLTARFNPDAQIFKTLEEWEKEGVEVKRGGIRFFDFCSITAQGENLTNRIVMRLERKENQRLAAYLIRKNQSNHKCFDILQASYEEEEENVTILYERQSRRELTDFIIKNVQDQEIDFEDTILTFVYPDTSLDAQDKDLIAGKSMKEMEQTAANDLNRLYNMLCCLCGEHNIEWIKGGETVETAIRYILDSVIGNLTDSMYKKTVLLALCKFYGIEQENIRSESVSILSGILSESMDYKQKRECLKDIKRTFDMIVYNIESYVDKEIIYVFKPSVMQNETVKDVRGEHMENPDDFYDYETNTLNIKTARFQKISEMPSDYRKYEGIWIRKDDEELPVKIEYYEEQLVICKSDETVPFSVDSYNGLIGSGYEMIVEAEFIKTEPENMEEVNGYKYTMTPAEREWTEETQLEEFHYITLCLWQLRDLYRQRFGGISYKIFYEIYKEKVKKGRYEKKIELTLKSCENLSELIDSFYYQILKENGEQALLQEYFVNGGPSSVYVGDLIEIYSVQDNIHALYYVDTKGFAKISEEEFYGYEDGYHVKSVFHKQYETDRILAMELHLKVDEQMARIMNVIPQSVLKIPATESGITDYRREGVRLAQRIISLLPYVPVLICNSCISMLQGDAPDSCEKLSATNCILKKGKIVPFRQFCEAIDAYQDVVYTQKDNGLYQGFDIIDFLIFGENDHTKDIYIYFSSRKIGGKYQMMYDCIKEDMNRQYARLYEEYRQRRKKKGGKITSEGRADAKQEMDCYIQIVDCINKAVNSVYCI